MLSLTFWAIDAAVNAGVFGDLFDGGFDGAANDFYAELLVFVHGLLAGFVEDLGGGADDGYAATGEDAFFDCGATGVKGVFDAGLLFLHGDFRRGADVDLGYAAG